jgi:uncharacterized cupin superfamily protein
MDRKPARLLRAQEIAEHRKWFSQRLNPRSRLAGTPLASLAGFARTGVDVVTLPPGAESFAYHAHSLEEEWLYVLSGRGVALVDGAELELSAGDFLGFPTPSVPHLMSNRSEADLVYLEGGERRGSDVVEYPQLGKRYLLLHEDGRTSFYELGEPTHPYGPAEPPERGR